jgi:molecular chaperone DnaK
VRGLLAHLKNCFERTMHVPLTHAVVTVPAHEEFDLDYRARVRNAAMSGDPIFESITTIPEPDAVLLSIGDLSPFMGTRVLVFDMGGGTLDVSVREVDEGDGDRPFLRQLAVVGSDAAGRRVTEALAARAVEKWENERGFTFSSADRELVLRNNYLATDDAKKSLSSLAAQFGNDAGRRHEVRLFSPIADRESYATAISVAEFVALGNPVCEDARSTVEKALARAGCSAGEIDHYFMVGGSSQLPMIKDTLIDIFEGRPPAPLQGQFGTIDSTLAVVRGAAIDDLDQQDTPNVPLTTPVLERRLPYTVSLVVNGGEATKCLIEAESLLPFGPVNQEFYVPSSGDRSIEIILVRGQGHPDECTIIAPSIIEFLEPGMKGDVLTISWYLDESGELTVSAFDKQDRELGVIRTHHLEE